MADMKIDNIIEYLPNASRNIPVQEDKFLFFFPPAPANFEEKFLFGLSLKTGAQIFAIITLIQAISSFMDIFSPGSFWLFFVAIFAFAFYFVISLYAFLATIKENYTYAKVSYMAISVLFLIAGLKYICKSVIKVIEFITPWDGDFLRLKFLVYVFGYGIYLFIYLYFIYIFYRYMIQLGNKNKSPLSNPENNDVEINLNEDQKNE